jgi:hypothetical protein
MNHTNTDMNTNTSNARRSFLKLGLAAPVISGGLVACGDEQTGKTTVVAWNETYLEAVRKGTLGPPMVSRGIALLHTAMYDAWAPYDSAAVATIAGPVTRIPVASDDWQARENAKQTSIAFAAYAALVEIYPAQKASFEQALKDRGYDPSKSTLTDTSPEGLGNVAAKRVIDAYRIDGANSQGDLTPSGTPYADYTGYAPSNTATQLLNPDKWQPQTFSNGRTPGFLAPHWGKVKSFGIVNGAALVPNITLPTFSSKAFKDQVDEVIQYTANLTEEQMVIADYWADGPTSETPPGTWCMTAGYVSLRDKHLVDDDIKMYFMLGNALKDAAICCWETKRQFDSARPISAIRALYAGQQVVGYLGSGKGFGKMAGETWMPFQASSFSTPPFAEFTSGHSTFSAAAAEILKRFTGSDNYGDSFTVEPGKVAIDAAYPTRAVKLSWPTFTAAAEQAGQSRLFGGIHFAAGNDYGKSMGRSVGEQVFAKASAYIQGKRA